MKGLIATLMMLLAVSQASAQGVDEHQTKAQLHSGRVKVWLGTALVVTGAFVVPATAARGTADRGTAPLTVGLVTAGAGTWLVWSGFQQQRKAVRPHTDFGLVLGRQKSVVVRRHW